jgi:hypothetical protein
MRGAAAVASVVFALGATLELDSELQTRSDAADHNPRDRIRKRMGL